MSFVIIKYNTSCYNVTSPSRGRYIVITWTVARRSSINPHPAHADGCGAQCLWAFNASIWPAPIRSSPAGCHARFSGGSPALRSQRTGRMARYRTECILFAWAGGGSPGFLSFEYVRVLCGRGMYHNAPFPDQFSQKPGCIISFVSSSAAVQYRNEGMWFCPCGKRLCTTEYRISYLTNWLSRTGDNRVGEAGPCGLQIYIHSPISSFSW